jgi:hypothetical protein
MWIELAWDREREGGGLGKERKCERKRGDV